MTAPPARPKKRAAVQQRKARTNACLHCGEEFEIPKHSGGFRRKYCSPKCRGDAMRVESYKAFPSREEMIQMYVVEGLSDRAIAERIGRRYTWVHKIRKHYGIDARPGNGRSRKKGHRPSRGKWGCKAKGEHTCRNCGAPADHLHHIVPRSRSRAGRDNMDLNGMALCFRCHRGFHDRRITIYRDKLLPKELAFAEAEGGVVWVENNYPYTPDEALRRSYCVARGIDAEDQSEYCRESQDGPLAMEEARRRNLDSLLADELEEYDPPTRKESA